MVHALETVHRLLAPAGCLIDIHPSPVPATVEVLVDGRPLIAGVVREEDGGVEYRQAAAALAEVVRRELFTVERQNSFLFARYADTLEELVEHLADTWEDAYLDQPTRDRVAALLAEEGGERAVAVREVVRITRLRALGGSRRK